MGVPLGGKWNTALNTPVLNAVWRDVVKKGQYRKHDWVVKLDPDTVFFPQRLRNLLASRRPMSLAPSQGPPGMYLNNCEFGLHGPVEVLSKEAVTTFMQQLPRCEHLERQPFGEDTVMDHCLRLQGVTRVTEFSILIEKACGAEPAPCGSAHVAFHPFKTINAYFGCWGYADKYGVEPEQVDT